MSRVVLYLASASLILFLSTREHVFTSALADEEVLRDSIELDSREQELRRKEQELLQAIDFKPSTPLSDQEARIQQAEALAQGAESAAVKTLEIRAPETVPVGTDAAEKSLQGSSSQDTASQDITPEHTSAQRNPVQPDALKELENHPALVPPRKTRTTPVVPSNRVRTKTYDEFPDGTTAKRVGSFYRIDRQGIEAASNNGMGRTRTVPLSDLTPANTTRRALLTSDELATIRSTSTYLKTGPTRLDSTLLKIPQYSEVTIDHRSGTWYRIKTTNGVRGWVPGSALLFDDGMNPRSTVRIGAVQSPLR
jgi:hypothetical protein